MAHQCIINIDNTQNPSPLQLQSISTTDTLTPSFGVGKIISAGENFHFKVTGGSIMAFGTLVWITGSNDTQASIKITFRNNLLTNDATLDVAAVNEDSSALLAYGVSYFYASQGKNSPMARDYINKENLAHSPVYVNYTIAFNTFVTNKPASAFLPGITNVVMLMLENRAFDHLLGMLYTTDPLIVYPEGSKPPAHHSTIPNPINFDGLFNNPDFSNPPVSGNPVSIAPVSGTPNIPDPDPGEGWLNTNQQIFNSADNPPTGEGNMQGFLIDYTAQKNVTVPNQIMQYYTPADLSVISTLAKNYAVSDAWHAAVPSQTTPNRAFSVAGTSDGYVDNGKYGEGSPLDGNIYGSSTIFNVLNNCGLPNSWAIYYQDHLFSDSLTTHLFEKLHPYESPNNVKPFSAKDSSVNTFLTDIANNTLPAFSYLEPAWYIPAGDLSANGNDYHPPANLSEGEANLAAVYQALTGYQNWNSTLFIVTFDEHGGTFDHVVPPKTKAPDRLTDWSNFKFDRLGVRIPTLLISPLIAGGTVFRSPTEVYFDHTSFVRTILGWQNIDISGGVMGARAKQAPDFSGVISSEVVNSEIAHLHPPADLPHNQYTQPLNDLQKLILPHLAKHLSVAAFGSKEHKRLYNELAAKKTIGELRDYVEILKAMKTD